MSRSFVFTAPDVSLDELCGLYTAEMTNIADSIAPSRTVTRRVRRSDLWFDNECRAAKRECRQLERKARRSSADDVVKSTWREKYHDYHNLIERKRTAFWSDQIETLQQEPRHMWRVIDDLLGRVNNTACSCRTVSSTTNYYL